MQLWWIFHPPWVEEPLNSLPTTAKYHRYASNSFLGVVLLSTFKRTQNGFAPGIYLPDFEEDHPQEDFVEEEFGDDPVN